MLMHLKRAYYRLQIMAVDYAIGKFEEDEVVASVERWIALEGGDAVTYDRCGLECAAIRSRIKSLQTERESLVQKLN